MKYLHYIIFFIVFLYSSNIEAQKSLFPTKKEVNVGLYLSTSGQNPFWLRNNQYGTVPLESQTLNLNVSLNKEFDSTYNNLKQLKKSSFGYGISPVVIVGKVNKILLPEAYIKTRLGAFEFYAGRRREIIGLVDTTLTSGSYIWSGNALPLPKVQITIPNYTSIIGNGLVSIKGAFAHGWFGSTDSTKKFFLHQKYLYGRIGKPNWKVKFYAGFNHQVQWGGVPSKPYIEKETGKLISTYGNDFSTYMKVVTGISLNKDGQGINIKGTPLNEALNRAGNHLGTIDLALSINLKNTSLLIYRQSIYEDGSLFYLNNITDGLLGFSISRNKRLGLLKIGIEYINTVSQGGETGSGNTIPELRGTDNYFNNSIYGWTYKNNTIGNALLMPMNNINPKLLTTNLDNTVIASANLNTILNNRLRGLVINSIYKTNNILFNTKVSRINNFGIYGLLLKEVQYSFLQSLKFKLKKYTICISTSIDSNAILKPSLGIGFCLSHTF